MSTPDEPRCTNWNCPPATELRETPAPSRPGRIFWSQSANIFHSSMGATGWWVVLEFQPRIHQSKCVICLFQMARRQSSTGTLLHVATTCNAIWIDLSHLEANGNITSQTESIEILGCTVGRLPPYFSCPLELRAATADSISAWSSCAERSWTDTAASQNEKADHSHERKQKL